MKTINLIVIILCLITQTSHASDATNLFEEVFDNIKTCIKEKKYKDQPYLCYIKSAPKKCKDDMVNFISISGDYDSRSLKSSAQRKLFFCIATCVDASLYARTFGECSRDN